MYAKTKHRFFFFPLCPAGEPSRHTENRATRCKVERLQLLLQQRRLRRRARREPRAPYHWLSERKATRSHSNSSLSSDGSIDLDYDEALWKNDVQADIGSEFVVAWTSSPKRKKDERMRRGLKRMTCRNAGIFSVGSVWNTKSHWDENSMCATAWSEPSERLSGLWIHKMNPKRRDTFFHPILLTWLS